MAAPARPVIVEESLGSSSLTYAVTSLPSRKVSRCVARRRSDAPHGHTMGVEYDHRCFFPQNEDRWAVKTQELPWAGASEGPNGMFAVRAL